VIVISQKVVKAAGLDFPTAIGLLQPAEGELVVCIHNVHDRISSPGITSQEEPQADEFGGYHVRRTHRASVPDDYELPTIAPTQRPSVSTALPMTAEEIDAERARHRLAAWTMTDAQRLGIPRLPGDTHG
jgi:hypothetical protein